MVCIVDNLEAINNNFFSPDLLLIDDSKGLQKIQEFGS